MQLQPMKNKRLYRQGRSLSDQRLLQLLRAKGKQLGRMPTRADLLVDAGNMPHPNTYARRFNSWEKALDQAGFSQSDQMLQDMLCLVCKLGRFPTRSEIDNSEDVATYATYRKYFGGLDEVKKALIVKYFQN